MIILGFDVATVTGWALIEAARPGEELVGGLRDGETGLVEYGCFSVAPEGGEEPEGVRYARFAEAVRGVLGRRIWSLSRGRLSIDAVGIEQPFSRNYRTAQILYGLTAVLLVELEAGGLEYDFVPASTLKAWAVPKTPGRRGLATKGDMRTALEGWLPPGMDPGPDETDAIHVARWLASRVEGVGAAQ